MILHNLTDFSPPYRPERKARILKIAGKSVEPGKSVNISDHLLKVGDVAGWLTSMTVSVDGLPDWYQAARRENQDRKSRREIKVEREKALKEERKKVKERAKKKKGE